MTWTWMSTGKERFGLTLERASQSIHHVTYNYCPFPVFYCHKVPILFNTLLDATRVRGRRAAMRLLLQSSNYADHLTTRSTLRTPLFKRYC